jgi:transmembrane sensor
MNKQTHPTRSATQELIAQEAVQWLCDLQSSSEEQEAQFLAWLRRSPQHIEEFLAASAVWRELDAAPTYDSGAIDALIADARASANANVVTLRPNDAQSSRDARGSTSRGWRRLAGIAAAAAAIAIGTIAWHFSDPAQTYSTHLGEQRAIRLEDGSVLHLNTRSKVRVRFSENERAVSLIEGQALFTVENDPARPFRVSAGDTVIEAVGTQFDVYRRASGTVVSVIEGVVKIEPSAKSGEAPSLPPAQSEAPHIRAGEQAQITRDGTVAKRAEPEVATLIAWRERRLVFRGETLEEVVAEFNRYLEKPIHIDTDAARDKRIAGTFNADDPESFMLFVGQYGDLAVTRTGSGYRIQSRDGE